MEYTNALMISNYLQRDLTTNEQAYLPILTKTVRKFIDSKLNSSFREVAATTRYFDGGEGSIDIDPVQDVTEVKTITLDSTLSDDYIYTASDEYRLEPLNEDVKRELRKNLGCFPAGSGNIAITGKFTEFDADEGVPSDIQHIATVLAGSVINQGKNASSGGNVASESLEGHSVTYDTSNNSLEGMVTDNPGISGLLEARRELYLG